VPLLAVLLLLGCWSSARPFPVSDDKSGLPLGSELDEDDIYNPREIFHAEAIGGHKSYLSNLGDLAFNSPYILGAAAQKAGISCASCHMNGAGNPKLSVPGLSTRPGTFDTTGALFNPKADDHVLDVLTIPSLRGARYLAPYGHNGRTASLRDFVRNVIVTEFAGAEPSPELLDAIVIYIEDIDFLPNPRVTQAGLLASTANASETRGEALFEKPFPHDPSLSCAACHVPSAAFVDHRGHDVGSGGPYKTPTLVNANFNAPYFHDGRFDNYGQVVDYFDHFYALALSEQDRADLLAYLIAVGDGIQPQYRLTGVNILSDEDDFASVLDAAISNHDMPVITLAVDTVSDQLQDLQDKYPDPADHEISGGEIERGAARTMLAKSIDLLHQVGAAAAISHFDEAAADYLTYRKLTFAAVPATLSAADPWSLFNARLHQTHRAALQQALDAKKVNASSKSQN
jgi:cytochrome c peroxidase